MDEKGFLSAAKVSDDAESVPRVHRAIGEDNVRAIHFLASVELVSLGHGCSDLCLCDVEDLQAHVCEIVECDPLRGKELCGLRVGGLEIAKLGARLIGPLPN